ncbi:MAG TPA: hypothetical protein GXZ90_06195 [Clostridiales bacterium]|nr:hypothetical protein [Clostridiales bacterium]
MLNQDQEYLNIIDAIDGMQDMILANKREIGDDEESDFAKMIIQQNKWLRKAIAMMADQIERLAYTE